MQANLRLLKWEFMELRTHLALRPLGLKYGGQPRTEDGRYTFGKKPTAEQQTQIQVAARRVSPALEAFCERQYDKDVFQCKMVGLPACYAQAALRYANCLKGLPIPPLNY